jgi:glycerol-3-phosphate dehydrogenase
LSVTGGKLTTYRAMAAQTVGEAMRILGYKSLPETSTHRLPLPGGDFGSLDAEIIVAREMVGHAVLATRLVERYGSEWRDLWELVRQERTLGDPLGDGIPYIAAEVVWAVEREMALTLADILVRRLHVAYETRDHSLSVAPAVAGLVAPILGWSAEDVATELAHYEADVLRMFGVEAEAGA